MICIIRINDLISIGTKSHINHIKLNKEYNCYVQAPIICVDRFKEKRNKKDGA